MGNAFDTEGQTPTKSGSLEGLRSKMTALQLKLIETQQKMVWIRITILSGLIGEA